MQCKTFHGYRFYLKYLEAKCACLFSFIPAFSETDFWYAEEPIDRKWRILACKKICGAAQLLLTKLIIRLYTKLVLGIRFNYSCQVVENVCFFKAWKLNLLVCVIERQRHRESWVDVTFFVFLMKWQWNKLRQALLIAFLENGFSAKNFLGFKESWVVRKVKRFSDGINKWDESQCNGNKWRERESEGYGWDFSESKRHSLKVVNWVHVELWTSYMISQDAIDWSLD